jgi:acetyl-CoA carboxylase carboxyltransferase component
MSDTHTLRALKDLCSDPGLTSVRVRTGVPGATSARVVRLAGTGRDVVLVLVDDAVRHGVLTRADSETITEAASGALRHRLPLVVVLASSGADAAEGVASLDGWGRAAKALAACSGVLPVIAVAYGTAVSGTALLLGLADAVVMTQDSVAFVSGPAAVAQVTGLRLTSRDLGGHHVHARNSGVATIIADDPGTALETVAALLDYLPDHVDQHPRRAPSEDPAGRATPELRELLPANATGSYDVRRAIEAIADDGEFLELRSGWAPQIVTALCRVDGYPVGVVANQPQSMAGTLDIAASQKAARFVSLCDSFNLAILTMVDTPGFMPGKDLEWRGMIRHGAELVFAYAEATVPRVCLVMRKAFGGAYIVMDSKGIGNDLCLAWPSAQIAVMGAQGAVQILHRREEPARQAELADEYEEALLNPYVAAARGFVDYVVDPESTRLAIVHAFRMLATKRERVVARKHGNGPL